MSLDRDLILEKDVLKGVGPTTIKKLHDAGLRTLLQIAVTPPSEVVERTGMGADTAAKVTLLAQKAITSYRTAAEYYKERGQRVKKLSTGVEEIDLILDGGFESGVITELIGPYASGKTQICYNETVLVQLPEDQGGLNGKALVIDTERTFAANRVAEIAEARGLSPIQVLENIHITQAYNSQHLEILVRSLPEKLQEGGFGLVVVDSMASHFRQEFIGRENLARRQQVLAGILGNLLRVAESFNVVVLVTNQITSNPTPYGNPNKPSLGNIMAHAGTHRIMLRKGRQLTRIAKILDSPYLPEAEAPFRLSEKGIEST